MESNNSNALTLPVAIVIAGALIGGAVLIANNGGGTTTEEKPAAQQIKPQTTSDVTIAPISGDDWILGSPEAPITIVEYSDTECPFCKNFHTTMQSVIDSYGKNGEVSWVYRHFPLTQLHPRAPKEGEALECAGELGGNKGFWDYTNRLYEITPANNGLDPARLPEIAGDVGLDKDAFATCLSSSKYADTVQSEYDDATRGGGRGTPFSVFVSKDGFSDSGVAYIEKLNNDFIAQGQGQVFVISNDRKRISMSGALPLGIVSQIIDALLD